MKKEYKRKWIKALLSGKYIQGLGTLKHKLSDGKTRYCCLGVLQEILNEKENCNNQLLGGFQLAECGLTSLLQGHLASMNDDGFSFKDIAHEIKTTIEGI